MEVPAGTGAASLPAARGRTFSVGSIGDGRTNTGRRSGRKSHLWSGLAVPLCRDALIMSPGRAAGRGRRCWAPREAAADPAQGTSPQDLLLGCVPTGNAFGGSRSGQGQRGDGRAPQPWSQPCAALGSGEVPRLQGSAGGESGKLCIARVGHRRLLHRQTLLVLRCSSQHRQRRGYREIRVTLQHCRVP